MIEINIFVAQTLYPQWLKKKMKKEEKRIIDILFAQYAESHQNATNRLIHWVCVPLIVFSIIGLVTAIPFPQLNFLGKYNMYINWFSFVMAASIYYYTKLSPMLSILCCFFLVHVIILLFS